MRRSLVVACVAVVAAFGSARAADAPVACGDVTTGPGIKSCKLDASAADERVQVHIAFHVINATAPSTNRVDLIDKTGRVRDTTGNVTLGNPCVCGDLQFEAPLPPGVYTCKLTTSGAPVVVWFVCAVL